MKKLTTLILMGLVCGAVWGQTNIADKDNMSTPIYHYEGNVGIGITNPQQKLHIQGTPWTGIKIQDITKSNGRGVKNEYLDGNNDGWVMLFGGHYPGQPLKFRAVDKGMSGIDVLTLLDNGNVGIGTTSPSELFEVNGNIKASTNTGAGRKLILGNTYREWDLKASGYDFVITDVDDNEDWLRIDGNNNWIEIGQSALRVLSNGYIGIGTPTPDAKLDVAGNIKAHEIEVTLAAMQDLQLNGTLAANNITYTSNGNTADFVFEDNYHLKDLSEVEAFIKANKHLPEVPSAAEMEEAGVNLAEMNKLLLMKVEELTLYSIELEKEVKRQKAEVEEVRSSESEVRREMEEKVEGLELKVEELSDEKRVMRGEMEERLAKMESLLEKLTLNP